MTEQTATPIQLNILTAWVKPSREPTERWVKGEILASWLAEDPASDVIVPWVCVAFSDSDGHGQAFTEPLCTMTHRDNVRICSANPNP